jgi:hypothetical protein
VPDEARVHIRYPIDGQDAEEAWLDAAASRNHGDLAREHMASYPGQRIATFSAASRAESFVDELSASGRWAAHIIGRARTTFNAANNEAYGFTHMPPRARSIAERRTFLEPDDPAVVGSETMSPWTMPGRSRPGWSSGWR